MENGTAYHVKRAAQLKEQLFVALSELMGIVRESDMGRIDENKAERAYELALRKLGGLDYHIDTLNEHLEHI